MYCKKCNTQNENDSIFCKQCGTRLKDRTSKRGFASMDKHRQKKIASGAGKKAHSMGRAHKWTSAEAKRAGEIGGRSKKVNSAL